MLAEPHTNIRLFGKGEVNGHRRLGVLLARDVSVEKALEKVNQAYQKIRNYTLIFLTLTDASLSACVDLIEDFIY